MGEGGMEREVASADPPQPHYGTFQGVSNYPPPPPHPQPAIGVPQPVPPPGASEPYTNAYQAFPVFQVGRNSKTYALLKQQMEVAAKSEDFRTKEKELQAKEAELRRREQDVYMYFRGSGKAAEMKHEAAKRTMMAALA